MLSSLKRDLRSKFLKKRLNKKKEVILKKSQKIAYECLKWLRKQPQVNCIALYSDFMNEVQTIELFKSLRSKKITIVYPSINKRSRTLEFYEVKNLIHMEKNSYSVLEPKYRIKKVGLDCIHVMFVPGILFDEQGFRLGYGKGYYDKVLKHLRHIETIGLAFEFQVVRRIPRQTWDRPVKTLITERKIRRFH